MAIEKIEELKQRHAEQIAKLERETECAERLPLPPDSIIKQKDEVWATYRGPDKDKDGRQVYGDRPMSVRDALVVFRTYRQWEHADGIEECEHWKSGCISTQPAELTSKQYTEHGEQVGGHEVRLSMEQGEGYGSQTLSWHVKDKRDGQWYMIRCHVRTSIHPKVDARYVNNRGRSYDGDGTCVKRKFLTPDLHDIEASSARKWSFGDGPREVEKGYHIDVYWYQDEFEIWAEREQQKETEREQSRV